MSLIIIRFGSANRFVDIFFTTYLSSIGYGSTNGLISKEI